MTYPPTTGATDTTDILDTHGGGLYLPPMTTAEQVLLSLIDSVNSDYPNRSADQRAAMVIEEFMFHPEADSLTSDQTDALIHRHVL